MKSSQDNVKHGLGGEGGGGHFQLMNKILVYDSYAALQSWCVRSPLLRCHKHVKEIHVLKPHFTCTLRDHDNYRPGDVAIHMARLRHNIIKGAEELSEIVYLWF